jgi:hypothetical protein
VGTPRRSRKRIRRHRIGCLVLLSIPTLAACGASETVGVVVNATAAVLTITVDSFDGDRTPLPSSELTLAVGDSAHLAVTGLNPLGLALGQVPVTWSSSDVSVLSVSAGGLLRAVAPGSAEITAHLDEMKAMVLGSVN